MNTHPQIAAAASLINDIDPALAQAFLDKPFHRHLLVTAFHKSLSDSCYSHLADHIAVTLRRAIDAEQAELDS